MATKASVWDKLFRLDLLVNYLWPLVKSYLWVPIVTGTIGAWLVGLTHVPLWQLYLGGLYGAVGGLLLVGSGHWVYRRLRPLARASVSVENSAEDEPDDKMEIIVGADFVNQAVEIDGRFFQGCHFQNATLVYEGRRGTGFLAPTFEGSVTIRSNNQAAMKYARFLQQFRMMPGVDSIQLHDHPEGGKFTPIGPIQLGPGTTISLDLRRVRLLEYHGMHLLWMRHLVSNPKTTPEQLSDVPRVIAKHRGMLLDLTPDVFPQSVVNEFREPAMYELKDSVRAFMAEMSEPNERTSLLARVDHLLRAIQWAWANHGGIDAPRP